MNLPIEHIIVPDRQRQDYGDLEALADSLDRFGLIQPIVLSDDNKLIAGGRRLAAAKLLNWTEVKVVYHGQLREDEREELELEENLRRKDLSWQERVLAIARIHDLKALNGAMSSTKWGHRETGELLGMSLSNVNYALQAAAALRNNDEEVRNCENMFGVMQLLLQRREDEALRALARPQPQSIEDRMVDGPPLSVAMEIGITSVPLSCFHTDAIAWMRNHPASVDHIVCDPPYGISMSNLQQDNLGMDVSRVESEHQVAPNLKLLSDFIQAAYRCTRPNAFCILWCDQANWDFLVDVANLVRWRVQRWPVLWVKTDPCQNGAAQYNFTKRHEIALVLRKEGACLKAPQTSSYWVGPGEDKEFFNHPFAKPRDLWKWLLDAVSNYNDTILDPFAGCGTCPVACIETGRHPIALESNELHYNACLENMKRAHRLLHGPDVTFITTGS